VSKKQKTVCGLDVGTDKVCCLIALVRPDNRLQVAGYGYAQSAGLKKGVVVNLEEAAASIRKAAREAELKSSLSADWVTVGISGEHVQSYNSHGAIDITGKHREVTSDHMTQVIQAAQASATPPERELLHVLPQEFYLDNRGGIRDPIGLTGQQLDADVHVVTCDSAMAQNLVNAVNKAEMRVRKVVLPQLADTHSVLTQDEKELGVALIDIGGGTSDIALITQDAMRYAHALPVGGAHFTRDLSIGLRAPLEEAERLKKEYGSVYVEQVADAEVIEFTGISTRGTRDISRRFACGLLRDRAEELLELINEKITRSGFRHQLVSGAVLTGGGSMLHGMLPLAAQILEMPVRLGLPQSLPGLPEEWMHPIFATAVGLIMLARPDNAGIRMQTAKTGATPLFVNRFLSWVGS